MSKVSFRLITTFCLTLWTMVAAEASEAGAGFGRTRHWPGEFQAVVTVPGSTLFVAARGSELVLSRIEDEGERIVYRSESVIWDVVVTRDGTIVAVDDALRVIAMKERRLKLERTILFPATGTSGGGWRPTPARRVIVDPTGRFVVVGPVEGKILAIDLESMRPRWRRVLTTTRLGMAAAFDEEGETLAVGEGQKTLIMDWPSLNVRESVVTEGLARDVSFLSDGRLVTTFASGQAEIRTLGAGASVRRLRLGDVYPRRHAVSLEGSSLTAIGCGMIEVAIGGSLARVAQSRPCGEKLADMRAIGMASDGTWFLAAGFDGMWLWERGK